MVAPCELLDYSVEEEAGEHDARGHDPEIDREDAGKEKLGPRGRAASIKPIKPIKRGTAEQERKGVARPGRAARMLPANSGRPPLAKLSARACHMAGISWA
jgi:hypothetical protein